LTFIDKSFDEIETTVYIALSNLTNSQSGLVRKNFPLIKIMLFILVVKRKFYYC